MSDIPRWAAKRAAELINELSSPKFAWSSPDIGRLLSDRDAAKEASNAFARYIAEHEDEPVDPVLIEARNAADSIMPSMEYASGVYDDSQVMRIALAALKRGMELERSK